MSGFSIIAILKEIITFNKESMHFFEQKYKLKNKTESKWKIVHIVLERRTLCFSSYKNHKLKVKLMSWSSQKKKEGIFCTAYFLRSNFLKYFCFISMYCVLNTLSKYTYFFISKSITSYTFLFAFKIFKSLQCILKVTVKRGI